MKTAGERHVDQVMNISPTRKPCDNAAPAVVPLDLWLQWHGDGAPEDASEVCESEVTWSREKIFDHDVEYVHADEIRRVLMGHRRSELWGDKGLIAATMRCVDAIGMIEDLVTTDHETKEAFIQRVRGILGRNSLLTQPEVE